MCGRGASSARGRGGGGIKVCMYVYISQTWTIGIYNDLQPHLSFPGTDCAAD